MLSYIIRRLLLMLPTLLGVTLVVFVVMAAAPGGISSQSLVEGQGMEPEMRKVMEDYYNRIYGLDDPAYLQYARWLNNVSPIGFTFDEQGEMSNFPSFKGSDLGTSFRYGRPVLDILEERVPITLLLNLLSLPIIYIIAITVGMRAATQRGKAFDTGSGMVMLTLWSIPTMLAGVLLIGFFASDQHWHWFPTAGLNRRDALDMPFLPHWSVWLDVLWLFLFAVGGSVAGVWFSRLAGVRLRTAGMALLGLGLGILMVSSHGQAEFSFGYLILILFCSVGFGLLGYVDYPAMRNVLIGLSGFAIAVGLAVFLMQGEFVRGWLLDRIWHLVLPVIALSYGSFAFLSKLTRTAVLENLRADYARTARAKGLDEKRVLWRHVFRNSLLPLITVFASLLPGLLAGSLIVETVFSIDGMGRLAVDAVKTRDRELVLSITLISGLLTLTGNLIADILYAAADPRVSYE